MPRGPLRGGYAGLPNVSSVCIRPKRVATLLDFGFGFVFKALTGGRFNSDCASSANYWMDSEAPQKAAHKKQMPSLQDKAPGRQRCQGRAVCVYRSEAGDP